MAAAKKKLNLTKIEEIQLQKIKVFFKRSILNSILKILTMEHSGFRTFKSVKNINRLFTSIDEELYKKSAELSSYIWCISFISKQWLDGIVNIDLIIEACKRSKDWDNIKEGIITSCMKDQNIITEPEAKMIFELITEALQYGYLSSIKEEYISLLDDINLDHPGAFKELAERLFNIAHSLIDIKHNTNFISNNVTFSTADMDSVTNAVSKTINSLSASNNMFKVGIRRWNTLLSPAYMNGKLYTYLGLPGSYKSGILLKSALDIRKYNPDFKSKTPGMKPCVLLITMENSFTETIERIWNMTFDDSIADYSIEEAVEKIQRELGIGQIRVEDDKVFTLEDGTKIIDKEGIQSQGIEVVIKYFSYREISTDDLFTIIQDLRDENLEVCAFVFDYIKRIRPNMPAADNVKIELGRIINELKALAVIMDIPVITAHQFNRAAAAVVDNAVRQGRGDVTKLIGRENIGDAWEVYETSDWVCSLNTEYKPGSLDEKFLIMNVLKRRYIDSAAGDLAKYTYLAHPFARNNSMRLLDDMNLDKILSLQSLVTDIDMLNGKEKTNAVPRLNKIEQHDFVE